ncbi:Rv0340 family IniB-related protein [Mycobacterium pseudokansasii]|uniref:Isoniazid-induced protein IniB n=1 Tax=Mycobacterium pseudokansasii TaxID=2341080 RepID=A0A498QLT1_9MYCO|nr:IniB N-terminal domain-containing protein [Mycobacterium pseudokansasii]EUA14898.1 hypothetical protein I546_1087 [Mycobacterium kansasii 732]VBA46854.1 hypothetical protein LAUMK142_00502 [Mycobacterium pseudokansasii]
MANSLLDFVISLVRDAEAAARYAANPAQAIADAHLTNVTSADVNNLIPVVSDSLSMAGSAGTAGATQVTDHGNVWASGAATAALDAFSPHSTAPVVQQHSPASYVINEPVVPRASENAADPHPVGIEPHQPSVLVTGADTPDSTFDDGSFPAHDPAVWDHPIIHPHTDDPDHHGFGIHG